MPVLILEGARAVGKTTMVRLQLVEGAGYSYATLADRATLEFAKADPQGWLRRLVRPAVIDEAQLLPTLPLLIKEIVDNSHTATNQFVLTGSASIGRTGLGGADPLARRSLRLTMWPLTGWELAQQSGNLADCLIAGTPVPGRHLPLAWDELLNRVRYGGWPGYVLPSRISAARLRERVASDIVAVLATTVDPQISANAAIAQETLDALLRTPGDIFNATRLSQLLGFDKRTVDRYMGLFQRLFLVHWLPNSATSPARQSHTRAKVHPVDTSLSVEFLERAGTGVSERVTFGHLLESYVVNQVLASRGWGQHTASASFWRDAQLNHEVDLVLDARDGQRVGIEVKSAERVTPTDIRGLLAMRNAGGMTKGYVVYTGSDVVEVADQIWTLPVSALDSRAAFT
ncbi:MAG: DUF4143 domain-containing protein [Propionibacteriaceae bacterium]|nr:DUF4143 domain-containing protein [Propionibacteriaceae bacterium]